MKAFKQILACALLAGLGIGANVIDLAQAADQAKPELGFFVTSRSPGKGGDLGGLAGADQHCQSLAAGVGAGARTWRAYLSAAPAAGQARVDARDRIGQGPWRNAKGEVIADSLATLHSDRNNIDRKTAVDESGRPIDPSQHDILTGSDENGRLAFSHGVAATCGNWTRSSGGFARLGHHDRYRAEGSEKDLPHWDESWISRHDSISCSAKDLPTTGSGGLLYCFAADAPPAALAATHPHSAARYSYRRGVNVNHWLGDNLPASVAANSDYAEGWFNEEDIAWIADQGFDHLRIHVNGGKWLNSDGDLVETAIAPFDKALHWANQRGLGVVLSMTGLPRFRSGYRGEKFPNDASPFSDDTARGHAAYLWWLVGRRYAAADAGLRFELINAPDAGDAAELRAFNHESLRAIRRTSENRVVYLTSRDMDADKSDEVDLTDPNTAYVFSYTEPELLTWQFNPEQPSLIFPGRIPDLARFATDDDPAPRKVSGEMIGPDLLVANIESIAARLRALFGEREVYVAALSVSDGVDEGSALAYLRAARPALEREGMSWAVYDYHTGGAIRDAKGKPTRVLEGLGISRPSAESAPSTSHTSP